jgi:hypothetical protein
MHHSPTCGMDATMLLIVLMIHIIHVFRTIHMAHIIKWEQIVRMVHVGCVAVFVHMVCVGQLLQMLHVGDMVPHVPYSQVVHTSMDLPNEYKQVFTCWSKIKIMSTPNVQDFIRSCAYE